MASGTYSKVYRSTLADSGDVVAVKKLRQNKKHKNRELEITKEMAHTNVIHMQHAFFTIDVSDKEGGKRDSLLNIVMDYIPMNVGRVITQFNSLSQPVYPLLIKLYAY